MTRQRHLRNRSHRRVTRTHGRELSLRVAGTHNVQPDYTAIPRCADCGKIRYATQREADLALATLDRTNPARREKNSYRCTACDGWHLTSWTTTEHGDYVAVAFSTAASHYRVFPLADYVPASEITREPLDLSSIAADSAAVPTPAEVAMRTASAPIEAQLAELLAPEHAATPMPAITAPPGSVTTERPEIAMTASPEVTPRTPLETVVQALAVPAEASPSPAEPRAPQSAMPLPNAAPALGALPPRTVPSPAEVAARTVPIKRAEAARRQAEATTKANAAATQRNPAPAPTKPRNMLRAMLRRLVRRLRRS
ncbi:hypothetical protein ACFXG4_20280 [Nocardia sp. NPDC059246]|uniref:hypothetical protein n=1 Tax=unclassified Nocardia TaxID=2637762 RepID=UPI00367AA653